MAHGGSGKTFALMRWRRSHGFDIGRAQRCVTRRLQPPRDPGGMADQETRLPGQYVHATRHLGKEVAKVEPLLVTHNKNGVIEGVKYDQLSVVLINAVKEQQQEIELLRAAKAELEQRLSALENLVRQNRSTKQARRRSAR